MQTRAGTRRRSQVGRREDGNTMVMMALLMTAFVGMLALTVDIGFLAGQRRFMQNGADAAALGTARLLIEWTSPNTSPGAIIKTQYNISNGAAYARAFDVASRNQNPGLTSAATRPVFTVTLEYCIATNTSGYVYTSGCTTGNGWVNSTAYSSTAAVPSGVYKVRATVHSQITTLFAGAVGMGETTETTGVAVALIQGVAQSTAAEGELWPLTTEDKDVFGFATPPGQLYELWGNQSPGSFKNVLDLTPAPRWCDGTNDFTWTANQPLAANNMPSIENGSGIACPAPPATAAFSGADASWNRNGFKPDPRSCYTGNDDLGVDVPNWLAAYWQGRLDTTIKVPVFKGNLGNNLNGPIHGQGNQLPTCTNTYFFQDATKIDPDHLTWGAYKDVTIFTYVPRTGGTYPQDQRPECWDRQNPNVPYEWRRCQGNGVPDRVTLYRKLTFRVYAGPVPNGVCAGLNSSQSSSSICGRIITEAAPPNTPTTGGPNIYGNVARMGE